LNVLRFERMKYSRLKELLFKLTILSLIVCLSVELLHRLVLKLDEKQAFTAALSDKHAFARSIPSPKILLVGGSGMMFCYNSAMISEATGLPVANMALLAPLGLKFILSDTERAVQEGDTVIMSFEYANEDVDGDFETQLSVADYSPDSYAHISMPSGITDQIKGVVNHRLLSVWKVPGLLNSYSVEDPYSIYFRDAFNREGDIVSHENNVCSPVTVEDFTADYFDVDAQLAWINHYAERYKQKGAKVYYTFPVVAESFCRNAGEAITGMEDRFREDLTAPLLLDAAQSCYPDSAFFDSIFHLKKEGRDLHSQKVISGLLATLQ